MADDKLPTYGEILDRLVRLESIVNNLVRYICDLEDDADQMLEGVETERPEIMDELRAVLAKHGITDPGKPKPQ